jgi:hypothetical protein
MLLTGLPAFHVLVSLVGIASGIIVVIGLLANRRFDGWTSTFLVTTVLTNTTGFLFPVDRFTPGHAIAIVSLTALTFAILARYKCHMIGGWARVYAITTVVSLYFNVFVLVAQMFAKIPALHALAPTQSSPAFAISQLAVLLVFVALGIRVSARSRRAVLAS